MEGSLFASRLLEAMKHKNMKQIDILRAADVPFVGKRGKDEEKA